VSATLAIGGFNERGPLRQCTLDELNLERLEQFVRNTFGSDVDTIEMAHRGGLIARVGKVLHPTAVGLLCFGKHPQWVYPQWGVTCVRIIGRTISDPLGSRREIEGPLPDLMAGVLGFIVENTRTVDLESGELSTVNPAQSEYSLEGLRELVANALIHRELKLTSRVSVTAYDDRIVIRSPGGPLFDAKMFDVLANQGGRSIPRNPVLASMARRLDLCEQIGRGLVRARRLSSEITRTPIRIEAGASELSVTVPSALVGQVTN
jgi:predicted HTH transcriptional regulator